MNEVITFIVNYWQYISIGLVAVLEIILLILKGRKPAVLSDGQYQHLIDWIIAAEKTFGNGEGDKKLQYVIKMFRATYPTSSMEDWCIKATVNEILKCPTKKGGLGREQVEQKSK